MCIWGLFYIYYKWKLIGKNSACQLTQDCTRVSKLWFSAHIHSNVIYLYVSLNSSKKFQKTSDPLCNWILAEKAQLGILHWHLIERFPTVLAGTFLKGKWVECEDVYSCPSLRTWGPECWKGPRTSGGSDSLSAVTGSTQCFNENGQK